MPEKMRSALTGLFALLPLFLAAPTRSEAQTAVAGIYSGLPVAYDPASGVISGYFAETTGRGQFSCIFYFSGQLRGSEASIQSYFPASSTEKIPGSLRLAGDGTLEISLSEEPGGCWNVRHFADSGNPASFRLDAPRPAWMAIDVVKSRKAYFHADATESSRRRSYVVQGDAVAIVGKRGDWYRVDFMSGGKATSGYLKRSDLYGVSESPPAGL